MYHNYWLTPSARDRNRAVRTDYFGQTVPAATGVFFAALASPKATEAIELVVALTNTVTLTVDNPLVAGRLVYKPHLTILVDSLMKDGVVLQSNSYTLNKSFGERNGVPVFRLLSDPIPRAHDPDIHIETLLDLKADW